MEQQPVINDHNKKEYPPMHTAEHILNATMVKMFGCPRSRNAHIVRNPDHGRPVNPLKIPLKRYSFTY